MRPIAIAFFVCLAAALSVNAAVTGTLINSDGQPVAGAKLSLYSPEPPETIQARLISATPERTPLASTTSDSKGKFSFESPKEAVVTLSIVANGFAPATVAVERDDERGAILLSAAPPRQGRITANGKPVAGAKVVFTGSSDLLAMTDAEGRYSVPDPAKWASQITVVHPDFAIVTDSVRGMSNKLELDRTLDVGTPISGRVVGEDGKTPVAAAVITINDATVAKSGDDGTFTAAHAPKKWQTVQARAANLAGDRARVAEGPIIIRLAKTATVSGTLRDSKTQIPVAGAQIRFRRGGRFDFSTTSASALTDAKGAFAAAIPAGSYTLVTTRPGYSVADVSINVAASAKATKNLVGTQLARVSGSVLDENKAPVAATRLEAGAVAREPGMRMMRSMAEQQMAVAGPDGAFVMRVEPDIDVQIEAKKKGYPEARTSTLRFAPGERKSGVLLTIPLGVGLTGHVVDRNGKPVSGVAVSASESVSGGSNFARRVMRFGNDREDDNVVRTAADGKFTMRLKPGTYNLRFKREGFASKSLPAKQVAASTPPVEVTLEPGVQLAGRVTRAGAGVEGVHISIFSEDSDAAADTAPDGSFRINDLTPGQAMMNISKQEDFIQQFRPVTIPADNLTIDLPAGGRISGRVVEKESKTPVTTFDAGVSGPRGGGGMMFMGPSLSKHFTSDDGTFVLENVPPGATTLTVNAPGFTTGRVSNVNVEDGKTVADVEVQMDRGVKVTGRVTGPDGTALSGVSVEVQPSGRRMPGAGAPRTATDASGEYSLDNVESGEKVFAFERNGYLATQRTVALSGADARVDAQLSTGIRLTGTVANEGGVPIADASVVASSASDSAFGGRSTRTDANGQFEMEGLSPGRYSFRASKSGYATGNLKDFDISTGAPVRIVVQAGGTITGHITGITSDELARAGVMAQAPGGTSSGTIDAGGNFRIEGAPTGTVRVYATVSSGMGGRNSPAKSVQLEPGGTAQVDLEFASGTVRGRITRDGQPASQAMVVFSPQRGQATTMARTSTDNDGNYEASGLADATYDVQVIDLQRGTPYTTTYQVQGSSTFNIDIKSATVRGRVLDATTGRGVEDAAIQIRGGNEGSMRMPLRTMPTDSSGAFVIDSVPPGTYSVTAEKDGYGTKAVDVTVSESGSDVEIKLAPNVGVTLRIVDARDGRLLSVYVRVTDSANKIVYDSPFRFTDGGAETVKLPLDSGVYRATIFAQGYATQNVTISSPSTQTIGMTPGGAIAIKSSGSAMRRARLIAPDGRQYTRGFGGPTFAVDASPGTTLIENVAPGTYTLQILGEGDAVTASVQVTVLEGQVAQVSA